MVDSAIPDELVEHVIITRADGEIDPERVEAARAVVKKAVEHGQVTVHLHGGLVGQKSGLTIASNLLPVYKAAGTYPIFVVWNSGPFEILSGNIDEILGEELFRSTLTRVLRWAVGLAHGSGGGGRTASVVAAAPDMDEVAAAMATEAEPYAGVSTGGLLPEVRDSDVEKLELEVRNDEDICRAVLGALMAAGYPLNSDSRAAVPNVKPMPSRIDPDVLKKLAGEEGSRSLASVAALAVKLVKVLRNVRSRFAEQVDHGIYLTVLEELARELYVAHLGGVLWKLMKKETRDTFLDGKPRAGKLIVDELLAAVNGSSPQVVLVGHSTGAVYINNFLNEIRRRGVSWPDDNRFTVALLAPACTTADFADMLDSSEPLIGTLRMFTMDDATECKDRLVGALYPRSLLYLVSGLVEGDDEGSAHMPLIGLERYLADETALDKLLASKRGERAKLKRMRHFLLATDCVVRSPSAPGAPEGYRAAATSHSDFDDDPLVHESLQAMIRDSAR